MPRRSASYSPQELHHAVHTGLMRCNASRFTDAESVTAVADALDRWVSAYPEQARDVEHLSLSACYSATLWQMPGPAAQLGAPGLVASLIRPKPTAEDQASAVLLTLLIAEASLSAGRLRDGQILLDDATHSLRQPDAFGALAPYMIQRLELLCGSFSEAALESADAGPHFARALETGEPLLRNRIRLRSVARQWVPMVFGNGPALLENGDEQAADLLKHDLLQTYFRAALGYARTADDPADGARTAADACIEFGLPQNASTLDLRPALLALPAEDLERRADALLAKADELDKERRAAWRAMIRLARGRVRMRAGGTQAMATAHKEAAADLKKSGDAMTWTGALADMLAATDPSESGVRAFLLTYGQVISGDTATSLSLPLRVQFDEAIGAAGRWAFEVLRERSSAPASRALSVILDALRSPDADELPWVVEGSTEGEAIEGRLKNGYHAALDRLGRLQYAMSQLRDSCALVMQTVGDEVLFAAATGDAKAPLTMASAGEPYPASARALAQGLVDAIRDATLDTTSRIEQLGQAAFDSLPDPIKTLLRERRHIYLLPDFWADREGIPFELFHDGQDFLCLSKIISRSLSLRELVRTVEPPVVQQKPFRRAVCLAVPKADGLPPLEYAVPEVRSVRLALEGAKWDAPDTESTTFTSTRLLEAMEVAGVTHIAAHGKVYAGGEALILSDGSTLTVDDITDRPRLLGGLVFLNACSLGRVRYLGAGLRAGIAAALVRAGAPCVIANLLPVEDRSASELATSFYEASKRHPSGEALRLARKALAERGIPPSRWGTTMLLGSPRFTFADRSTRVRGAREVAAELLYSYSAPDQRAGPDAMIAAMSAIEAQPHHVRLRGALDWVWAAAAIDPAAPAATCLAAARVAGALDCRPAEGLFLFAATHTMKEPSQLRQTLDRAIWALEPLAPLNDVWRQMHLHASAERQKLDAREEIPFIDAGGLRVNDQSDPAVKAILQIQHALDRRQLREAGALRLHRPERTLADVTWNAIVIGQQNRFQGEDAQAGCAGQMAGKLAELGLIRSEMEVDVRRVCGGLLPFLWESQRLTHLEPERALGQSETLRLMTGRIGAGWDAPTRAVLQPLAAEIDSLERPQSPGGGNKFLRALEALKRADETTDPTADLESRVRDALDRCDAISPHARAEAAAWSVGLLLERAYQCRRAQPPRLVEREQILQVYRALAGEIEGLIYPYLMDGFKPVREGSFDFIQRWKLGLGTRKAKTPRKRRTPAARGNHS
jgi:CHAT domain-containing protein